MPKRIFLSSGRTPSSLELARALAQAGCYVVVADCYPTFICQSSKSVAKTYVLPSPRQQAVSFELAVLAIIREEAIDLLIPGSEEVMYLATFREEIQKLCDVFFCDSKLLLDCHHKQAFNELAHSFGLPVPASTQVYSDTLALSQLQKQDFVLKRCFSRGGNAIVFAASGTHLKACGIPFNGTWLIQEKIAGETLCAFSIVHRGQVKLTQIYVPSVTLGTIGVVFKGIKEDRILNWIEKFTSKTGYHGFISFDFIRDKSGNIFAVECNPRVTSGVHLLPPRSLAQAILNSLDPLPLLKAPQRAQIAFGVLSTVPDLLINPRLVWHTIKECLRSREVIFRWSDLWPILYQIRCYLYFLRRSRAAGIPLSGCAMDGIEWNG